MIAARDSQATFGRRGHPAAPCLHPPARFRPSKPLPHAGRARAALPAGSATHAMGCQPAAGHSKQHDAIAPCPLHVVANAATTNRQRHPSLLTLSTRLASAAIDARKASGQVSELMMYTAI